MELIPFVYIQERKIHPGPADQIYDTKDLINQIKTDTPLYIYDLDGINHDKPNLCLLQKINQNLTIWMDSGPRDLGDVVDLFMAGANTLTIRKDQWPHAQASVIRDITEQQFYLYIDSTKPQQEISEYTGLVLFYPNNQPKKDFILESTIKSLCQKNKVYIYDPEKTNYDYWKKIGAIGLLVPLTDYPEPLKHVY